MFAIGRADFSVIMDGFIPTIEFNYFGDCFYSAFSKHGGAIVGADTAASIWPDYTGEFLYFFDDDGLVVCLWFLA